MALKRGPKLEFFAAVLGLVIAGMSAWGMRDRVRAVDILTLFFGGLAAGIALANAIAKVRAARAGAAG